MLPDDVAKWSGSSSDELGAEPYECGYGVDPKAHTMQTVLGQNGPTLYASSGICLLIAIYALGKRIGAIVHLAREETLCDEAEYLIKAPFTQFPGIQDAPSIKFISSEPIRQKYCHQIQEAQALIQRLASNTKIDEIIVEANLAEDAEFPMSVDIELDTAKATLTVFDEYGDPSFIQYW